MITSNKYMFNNLIENDYKKLVSLNHRKKFAQFFTPYYFADLMAKWILGNKNLKTVLEPAFGLGVFSRAILNYKEDIDIQGFEIDSEIYQNAKLYFENTDNVKIVLKDYMFNDWKNKYDGIVCNPPYFKFHDYDNKAILQEIEKNLKFKLNGFTNLYTLFLLKSIYQLNPSGRCAFIVPSEFLNSDYGKLVKSYLLKSTTLRHLIVINFEENVFEDALTTACIILCSNDNLTDKVQFTYINSSKDLNKIEKVISSYPNSSRTEATYSMQEINPKVKWKVYYQRQNGSRFNHLIPFSTYAKVVRGIATGANNYFTFNLSKAKEFGISEKDLLPCICSSKDIKKPFFTTIDFEILKKDDKKTFLFNPQNIDNINVQQYIKKGESENIDKKHLTANRSPWYSLENRKPSPILVSVFNRTGLRFVRNEANVSNLTSFHCVYVKDNNLISNVSIDLLFAYLLTNTAREIFEDNSREYGDGLRKFEPNDLNNAMMLNLDILDEYEIKEILNYYDNYRKGQDCLDQIDQIFIKKFGKQPQTSKKYNKKVITNIKSNVQVKVS